MKKIICLILTVLMLASLLVACGIGDNQKESRPRQTEDPNDPNRDGVTGDYGGKDVRIYTRDNAGGDSDGEYLLLEFKGNKSLNRTLNSAVTARNRTVEGRLQVTLQIQAELGGMNNAPDWNNRVRTAATSEENDLFDICALYASQASPLAAQGAFLDVNLLPEGTLDLSRNWWNQILRKDLEIDGSLFMLCGDLSLTSTAFSHAIFYNKNLYNKYFANNEEFLSKYDFYLDELTEQQILDGYTLIHSIVIAKQSEWTLKTLSELASMVYVDNGTQGKNDGDIFGMSIDQGSSPLDAWTAALNLNIVNRNQQTGERELAFANQTDLSKATDAWNISKNLLTTNKGVHTFLGNENKTAMDEFAEGNSVFTMARLCDAEKLRDTGDWEYGILPLPKYENVQEEYYTLPHNSYSLIAVAANLAPESYECIGKTLQVLGSESKKKITPTYYEVVLKSQYSNLQVDADMYDLILKNIKLDFAAVFSTQSLGGISNNFRYTTDSFSATWNTKRGVYQTALTTLISGLEEQARRQKEYLGGNK